MTWYILLVIKVHVSSLLDPVAGMLACSDNMFVHNNSKHGRKSRKVESAYGMCGCTALFWRYTASQVKGIPN